MCTQKPPHDYSEQLYNRYRDVFCVYINESVRHGGSYAAFELALSAPNVDGQLFYPADEL